MEILLIYIILLLSNLELPLSLLGIPAFAQKIFIETNILFLFIVSLRNASKSSSSQKIILIFVILSFVYFFSYYLNDSHLFNSLLFYRNLAIPIIFFFALKFINISEYAYSKLLKLVKFIFIIQIIFSIIKYFLIGPNELYVGTLSLTGGTLSTMFPLFAINFYVSFLVYSSRSSKKFIYFFIILGFVFMSWVGLKRAFYFFLPFFIFLAYYLYNMKLNVKLFTYSKSILLLVFLIVVSFIFSTKFVHTFANRQNRNASESLNSMSSYTSNYLTNETNEGYTTGRISSTFNGLNQVSQKVETFLFGFGPDSLYGSTTTIDGKSADFKMFGGITGFTFYILSIGLLGVILTLLIYYMMLKHAIQIDLTNAQYFWRPWILGVKLNFILLLVDYFAYSRVFINSYTPILIFLIVSAGIDKYGLRKNYIV